MSEFLALHNVSLQLVGNIQVSPSISYDNSEEEAISLTESTDSIPDDERLMDCLFSKKQPNNSEEETTGIEAVMQPEQEKDVLVLVDDETSGPDESRWRAYGLTRRRRILEEDRKNGGRNFSLSFDCSVQRYFSVAHWALEQFHQLYQSNSSDNDEQKLEEMYVMGFRIISFLTECLPEHPGFKPASLVQERSKHELEDLRNCLRDVALKIDECVCNKFVEDGDMFLDSLLSSEMDEEDADDENESTENNVNSETTSNNSWSSPAQDKVTVFENWVNFDEFDKMEQQSKDDAEQEHKRNLSDSPTSETVGTTGSDSGDAKSNTSNSNKSVGSKYVRRMTDSDNSIKSIEKTEDEEVEEKSFDDEDSRVIREDVFEMDELSLIDDFSLMDESVKSYSSQPFTLLRKSVNLNFLKSIACEPVLFETDSDAADSWANNEPDPKSRPCVPSSSGVAPTSDPARLAFRNLMSKLPHKTILKRHSQKDSTESKSDDTAESPRPASPTFSDIMEERDALNVSSLDEKSLDEVVDHEIEEYLDKKLGKLDKKLNSFNKKLGKLDRKLNKDSGLETSGSSRSSQTSKSKDSSLHTSSSASMSTAISTVQSASSRRSRRSRVNNRKLKPSTSYGDSSYSSYSTTGVYTDLGMNRSNRSLESYTSSDFSAHSSSSASASHQNTRRTSRSRRKVHKQRSTDSSDDSSYSSASTSTSMSSADQQFKTRRSRRGESNKHSVSSDTSFTSTETPSSSYTSLASLRRQEGSENSAFVSVSSSTKKRQGRKQKREKSVDSKVQDDWISFDNLTGNGYFANAFK
eukprot:CAMPEP_0197176548 /NCGR_PEP_ID=MMETSP1423-20130617/2430_1 /TAXON_ID=476441 /ORGANISM="Pseudo-nitzschia heimii, Strain UNC1101" /LENGTH=805 /DNA_ID=CAMNT_0042625931 /DNA_START=218 /DNA_END=2635 /DNA_ORIENTATION=-